MRLLGLGLSCLMLTLLCSSPLLAQTESKTAQASIVFDVRMEKLMDSPLAKAMELKDKMAEMPKTGGPDVSKMVRIFGAATAPESVEDIQSMQQGDLPVEFFVRFQFTDADGANSMLKQAIDDNDGTVERNGKTYYKAPAASGAPAGVMMYSPDEKTVEIGTEGFVFRSDAKPFTKGLNSAWGKVSDDAIRVAFDLDSAGDLVDELVKLGQDQVGQPMVGEMMNVFKEMKSMSMSFDLAGKNLMTMQSTGKTAESATKIKETLDGVLFMAKQGGKQAVGQMKNDNPEGAKTVGAILDGMNANQKGDDVTVAVPRPEGFEKTVMGFVEQFGPMIGMGGMSDGF